MKPFGILRATRRAHARTRAARAHLRSSHPVKADWCPCSGSSVTAPLRGSWQARSSTSSDREPVPAQGPAPQAREPLSVSLTRRSSTVRFSWISPDGEGTRANARDRCPICVLQGGKASRPDVDLAARDQGQGKQSSCRNGHRIFQKRQVRAESCGELYSTTQRSPGVSVCCASRRTATGRIMEIPSTWLSIEVSSPRREGEGAVGPSCGGAVVSLGPL